MPWQQLTLRLKAHELAQTEALLRLIGAESIAIGDDTDTPILEPEPGTTPLWPKLTVKALFDAAIDLGAIGEIIGFEERALRIEPVADQDWLASVRQTITPILIGPRLRIAPAEEFPDAETVVTPGTLALHMGLAFGTGRHPTTLLCLEWLERNPPTACEVLDYGAGTGVLGLAALKLGARSAWTVDTDPQAIDATARNAALNGLSAALWNGSPAALPARTFDLILANILAEPLIELAASFAERQLPGARIVLSGILADQADSVVARYQSRYEAFERCDKDGWTLIVAIRRS